ncbi:hypothetical protein EBB07_01600 [Paenibacillaceae bacterium]|nr:hypothetical protein EBB07_01600 [Paenibacillaceae bacterium]
MNTGTEQTSSGHLLIDLAEQDKLHILHPGQIIAYKGSPSGREDRVMDLAGVYRKRRWIRAAISGPSQLLLGLPGGCRLHTVPIGTDSNLLFNFRNVLFFSEGITMQSRVQSIKNAMITKDWVRMKFSGPGHIGVIASGWMESIQLSPDTPLYVDAGALIAYPENARLKLSVYGNTLASQHMKMQWELRGSGPVLIQTGAVDAQFESQMRQDGLIRRTLREVLPFGGVFIK